MKIINTPNMPPSLGHYSQCIAHNDMLYLSAQLPIDPDSQETPYSIEEQTDLALQNMEAILKEAGSDKSKVLRMHVYISNIDLWDKVNERYSLFFGPIKPARCIVPTRELLHGCRIMIEATAYI